MFKPNFSATMPGMDISIWDYLILTEGLTVAHQIRNFFNATLSIDEFYKFPSKATLYLATLRGNFDEVSVDFSEYPESTKVKPDSAEKVFTVFKNQAITYFKEATE